MATRRRCLACGELFRPCAQVKEQKYCSKPECQKERKRRWHREKLIRGFVRLAAIEKLGRDTTQTDIQEISEIQALDHLLADTEQRQWEAVEQAWIIRDLHERLGCSLREIERGIGYDASWVARRLSLIEGLSENILRSVATGAVSTYAASRVLVPLARANTDHAQRLVAHLADHRLSTRELAEFFKH